MTIWDLAVSGDLAQNAEKATDVPQFGEHVMEPKLDGWRIIAAVGEGEVTFFARSGKTYNGKLPHVEAELLENFPPGTWLDGEAVALRVEGDKVIDEWGIAQSVLTKLGGHAAASKITYMVFDLIAHAGIDARPLPYAKRRALLERIFDGEGFAAVELITTCAASMENYNALVATGFEGAMVKALHAPYASGKRGAGWLKLKPQTTVEAVVMGFKPGENGFEGMVGAVVFGQHDETGTLVERGRCSGMDMRTRLAMTNAPEKWLGKVIEIRHMGVSIGQGDTGRFRHPQFKRRRDDKTAAMVLLHDK